MVSDARVEGFAVLAVGKQIVIWGGHFLAAEGSLQLQAAPVRVTMVSNQRLAVNLGAAMHRSFVSLRMTRGMERARAYKYSTNASATSAPWLLAMRVAALSTFFINPSR